MNKKITVGLIGLATVIGVAGAAAATTYARGGSMMRGRYGFEQSATSTAAFEAQRGAVIAQRDAMQKAIDAGDYTAWKAAADALDAGRGFSLSSIITQANFPKFVEMNKLMQQADGIRKEIGLDRYYYGMGSGMMGGRGYGGGMMGGSYRSTSAATVNQ